MLVSRPLDYSQIDTGPGFLKLPVKPYLELIGIDPIPSQIAIVNAMNNPHYRFICAALSRRQGKTYIANILGQLVALFPGTNVLFIAPNYSLSQISFDLQRNLIKHFELEVVKDNAKDKVIELTNGSTIRMGSVNQVDSCLGRSYDLIVFDEAAIADGEEAFNIALRPTLDKPGSKALFISTPRGKKNWFSTFWQRGFMEAFPQWISIQATWHDNPRADPADVEEARRSMSVQEFRQEYEADFTTFEGQIWRFDSDRYCEDLSEREWSSMDTLAGLDIGFKDATACIVLKCDGRDYYVVDEYLAVKGSTKQHAEEIQKLMDKWDIDYLYIDAGAAQTAYDLASTYEISTIKAKKSVLDGIAHVSAIVENGHLIVDSSCEHTLAALDQYQWDPNPNLLTEKPVHNDFSHMADALRYALYSYNAAISTF